VFAATTQFFAGRHWPTSRLQYWIALQSALLAQVPASGDPASMRPASVGSAASVGPASWPGFGVWWQASRKMHSSGADERFKTERKSPPEQGTASMARGFPCQQGRAATDGTIPRAWTAPGSAAPGNDESGSLGFRAGDVTTGIDVSRGWQILRGPAHAGPSDCGLADVITT
jgi:hypothetical protein